MKDNVRWVSLTGEGLYYKKVMLNPKSRRANDFEEERKLSNPILSQNRTDILIFDLRKIDPLIAFESSEMKEGMLLLKIIRDPWEEFIEGWRKIREILNPMEETKRIDLEEEMLDYIFRSRLVVRTLC
jgi:hypothetical protein